MSILDKLNQKQFKQVKLPWEGDPSPNLPVKSVVSEPNWNHSKRVRLMRLFLFHDFHPNTLEEGSSFLKYMDVAKQ
jgi:hypothetical protein